MASKFAPGKARPGRKIKRKHKRGKHRSKSPVKRRGPRVDTDGNGFSDLAEQEAEAIVKRRERALKHYLAQTELEKVITKSLKQLIEQDKLPQNPYSYLIPIIRQKELDMQVIGFKGTIHKSKTLPTNREKKFITQIRDNFDAYGIDNVLQRIDPHVVGELMTKLNNIKGVWITHGEGDYGLKTGRIEVVTALSGPCVFFGSVLSYISRMTIQHDMVVTCKKLNDAMKTFCNYMLQNYEDFRESQQGFTNGITVVQKSRSGGKGTPKIWSYLKMRGGRKKAAFEAEVLNAIRAKQQIYMDCIVWLPMNPGKMVHGGGHMKLKRKKGKVKKKKNDAGVEEEVFSSDDDLDLHLDVDDDDHEGGYYRLRKEYIFHYYSKTNATKAQSFCKHSYEALALGIYRDKDSAIKYSTLYGTPDPTLDKHLYTEVKQTLNADVADAYHDADWIECCEYLLGLIVVDKKEKQIALLAQIFLSICGQLRQMAIEVDTLADAVNQVLHHKGLKREQLEQMEHNIQFQFKNFFKKHSNLVGGGGMGKSSTFAALKLSIKSRIDSILDVYSRELLIEDRSVRILKMVSRLYHVGELSIGADSMGVFVTVNALIQKYAKVAKGGKPLPDEMDLPVVSHLDVKKEAARVIKINRFPSKVARQAVVLQYFTDAEVDSTMNEIYHYLIAEPLYPNPYPHVTKILQGAWSRNQLWTQSDDAIEDELLGETPSEATVRDAKDAGRPNVYVETCSAGPNEKIYGNSIALLVADPFILDQLYDEIPDIHNNTDASQHMKNNNEFICTAIARDSCIESRISLKATENLPSFLEVHEHYCIEGNDKRSAIRLFIEHIMIYAKWFNDDTIHIMHKLSTGDISDDNEFASTDKNFNISQVKKNFTKVRMALKKAATDCTGICMHGFLKLKKPFPSDKFLYLRKWFILHWRNGNGEKNLIEHCSYKLPQAIYENVFFDQGACEIAMEAQLEPINHGKAYQDPNDHNCKQFKEYAKLTRDDVAINWKHGNIIGAYHALVPYCLMHQDDLEVLLDVTRMLRSPCHLIEHAKYESLVLQELIYNFANSDPELSTKTKASSMVIKKQVEAHRQWLLKALNGLGDVFVKGALDEINAKLSIVKRLVGTTDELKRDEAISMLQECTSYLYGVAACIADSIHANCPHIKEVIDMCVKEYEDSKHVYNTRTVGMGIEHIENPDDDTSDDD